MLSLLRPASAPVSVVVVHAAIASLFDHPKALDPVRHFFGGAALAYFLFQASDVAGSVVGQLTLFGKLALAFVATCTAALFWEFGEFFSDSVLGTRVQSGLAETLEDLLLGVGGAALFVGARLLLSTRTMRSSWPPLRTECRTAHRKSVYAQIKRRRSVVRVAGTNSVPQVRAEIRYFTATD